MPISIKKTFLAAFIGCFAGFHGQTVSGADSIYLQIPEIPGESTDDSHKDWIILDSISSSVENPSYGYLTLPPLLGDVVATKEVDKASPKLAAALTSGEALDDVVIELVRSSRISQSTYFEYRLKDTHVTSFQLNAESSGDRPIEEIALNYSRIDWIYRLFDPEGILREEASAFWDIESNTGGSTSSSSDNQPPTIEPIANQTVGSGATTVVDVTIEDLDSPIESLIVEAASTRTDLIRNVTISGTGSTRQLSFQSTSLKSGVGSISISVSDGVDRRSTSFSVSIEEELIPFEGFLAAYFSEEERADPSIASPIIDPDRDGIATLMEFLLGTNPREFNKPSEVIDAESRSDPGGRTTTIQFRRSLEDDRIQGFFWVSSDLVTWIKMDIENPLYEETAVPNENPLFESVTAIITWPSEAEECFIRYQIVGVF